MGGTIRRRIGVSVRLMMSLVLALSMVAVTPHTALAFDGPKQDAYNAQTATGASGDPFRILVTQMGDPQQTRPSAFWSGTGVNAVGGTTSITPFAVTFEQRAGNTVEGDLVSSMSFDMNTDLHEGVPTCGLLFAGDSPVWNIENPSWTYAFRLSPYTAQDTSTGDLRISFAWRGCFATYFDDWEYSFDAVAATANLEDESKRVHPGDTVIMTYYGGYDVNQTSRGTAYSVDFDSTATNNTAGGTSQALGDPAGFTVESVVGDDGYARFAGDNAIKYGGNYTVQKQMAPAQSWDASIAQDRSLMAAIVPNTDGVTYTLSFTGTGEMADYRVDSPAPWMKRYESSITHAIIGDGVTSIGSYALDLENVISVVGGNALSKVDDCALEGAAKLVVVNLSGCALSSVAQNSFGSTAASISTRRTVYVKDGPSAQTMHEGMGSEAKEVTAVAVLNGGTFEESTVFASGELSDTLEKTGFEFVNWTTDADLMHPAVDGWEPMTGGRSFYAHFVTAGPGIGTVDLGYKAPNSNQGIDQTVTLLDVSALPGSNVVNPDVAYYGADGEHYSNEIKTTYNGNDDIVFAFSFSRGARSNGGDGTYQRSFTLPYVSILNEEGETVATWDDGAGKLKLFSTVFDNQDGKTQGDWISAFRVGVEADTLPAGTYTLRFDKGFGANNGISFLGKNVDFKFTVERPETYQLQYGDVAGGKQVVGINFASSSPVDVVVPSEVDGVPIMGIAKEAFKGQALVKTVTLPAGITSVGDEAFSDMSSLEWVKSLSKNPGLPVWGSGVFTHSPEVLLYGFSSASTVRDVSSVYDNVTFAPLDDGVYVNGVAVEKDTSVQLGPDNSSVTVTVFADGQDVTDDYSGYVSNVNAMTHAGTAPRQWHELTAVANGEAELLIRDSSGADFSTVSFEVSGLPYDASTSLDDLTGYQGNGATIMLKDRELQTKLYDETLTVFDDYLIDPVNSEGTTFTLSVGGPGSGWSPDRWDWNRWTDQYFSPNIWLVDAGTGDKVATVGNGLSWITLTNDSDNNVIGVNDGVMTPGKTYTLVAGADMTGHNLAASLQKGVHWTFTVQATDIVALRVADIPEQTQFDVNVPCEPDVAVSMDTPAVTLWNETTESSYEAQGAGTRTLEADRDYSVSYTYDTEAHEGTAVIEGRGQFGGKVEKTFAIVSMTSLQEAIDGAQGIYDATPQSDDGSDVVDGGSYATAPAKASLAAAIESAREASAAATSADDLSTAQQALAQAVRSFTDSLMTAHVDISGLSAAYSNGKVDLEEAKISTSGNDVYATETWVTQVAADELAAALSAACQVIDDPAKTQRKVDGAIDDLNAAVEKFDGEKKRGLKTDFRGLAKAIENAEAMLASTRYSLDGSDVAKSDLWTTEAERNALLMAIGAAQKVLDNPAATQEECNEAAKTLGTAVEGFQDSLRGGLRASEGISQSDDGASPSSTESTALTKTSDEVNGAAFLMISIMAALVAIAARRRIES